MSEIIVRMRKGEDGKAEVVLGISLRMRGAFKGGAWEAMGRRKVGKKFIEGLCKQLVSDIAPQIQDELKQEQHRYEHPEAYPDTPEGELPQGEVGEPAGPWPPKAATEGPGLHPALLGSSGGGPDQPAVQSEDQKSDNGD